MTADPSPARDTAPAALRELIARQEQVRQQVARALHNEIGQAVSAIKMSAHLAAEEDDAGQRQQDLGEIVRIADDTVARLRELYSVLRPPQLDALGLHASLRGEAEGWLARWGVSATIEVALAEDQRAAPASELAAFRIVQDVLAGQARLSRLAITAGRVDDALALQIEHDGAAADAATLGVLAARAHACDGTLSVASAAAGAVRLQVRLPWQGGQA